MEFELRGVKFRLVKMLENDKSKLMLEVFVKNTSGGCASRYCDEKGPHWCAEWDAIFPMNHGLGRTKAWLKKNWDWLEPTKEPNTL